MSYFVVLSAQIKNNKLTESQIEILRDYYSRRYEAWEAWGDLYNTFERYGDQKEISHLQSHMHKQWNNFKRLQ